MRAILRSRPLLAGWLVALALALRLLVPTGYMAAPTGSGAITITLCPDAAPAMATAMPGMHHDAPGHPHDGAPSHAACPFAAAATPSLAGTVAMPLVGLPVPAATSPPAPLLRDTLLPAPRLRPPGRAPPTFA